METIEKTQEISYTIDLILKGRNCYSVSALTRIVEAYKILYSQVSYALNQDEGYHNQKDEDVRIDFSFQSDNLFKLIVSAVYTAKVHLRIKKILYLISFAKKEGWKEEFDAICIPRIRHELKELFYATRDLGVSMVIIKMPEETISITESDMNEYINNNDQPKECKMSIDVQEGMNYLNLILSQLSEYIAEAGTQSQFYENPQFIYRGITRFYPFIYGGIGDNASNIGNGKENQTMSEFEKTESGSIQPMISEIKSVKDDYIRSSLSVRLRDSSRGLMQNDAYIRSHYVNVLEEMIQKAQNLYPGKYTSEMSDLDILADLQHNGGSTCLVDFSKNVLTSIWFACNTDRKYHGYLYCYNVMEDMIKRDALTFIRPEDERMKISELLAQTYRETNVCSDVDTRFCLWEPSKKNSRIFRQDSVFLFGIEPFKVEKHAIKVIGIDSEWKLPILTALKAVFNISGSTVYNDYIGFATNTNKKRPYRKMGDTAYTRGYLNMIKGNYSSALDFLKLAEINMYNNEAWDEMKKMELHFSLGVCYKGLARQKGTIRYYENALLEYGRVISIAYNIVDRTNNENTKYYMHKAIRAYNARITLFYKLSRYNDAVDECEKIKYAIDNGWLKNYKEGKVKLTSKYCEISILEFCVLDILSNKEASKVYDDKIKEYVGGQTINSLLKSNIMLDFFGLLREYYTFMYLLLADESISLKDMHSVVDEIIENWRHRAKFDSAGKQKNDNDYVLWNFSDIKNVINSMGANSYFYKKKEVLQDITAGVISLRDAFQMYGWWSKEEV